jgi:hypothetical protein
VSEATVIFALIVIINFAVFVVMSGTLIVIIFSKRTIQRLYALQIMLGFTCYAVMLSLAIQGLRYYREVFTLFNN